MANGRQINRNIKANRSIDQYETRWLDWIKTQMKVDPLIDKYITNNLKWTEEQTKEDIRSNKPLPFLPVNKEQSSIFIITLHPTFLPLTLFIWLHHSILPPLFLYLPALPPSPTPSVSRSRDKHNRSHTNELSQRYRWVCSGTSSILKFYERGYKRRDMARCDRQGYAVISLSLSLLWCFCSCCHCCGVFGLVIVVMFLFLLLLLWYFCFCICYDFLVVLVFGVIFFVCCLIYCLIIFYIFYNFKILKLEQPRQ